MISDKDIPVIKCIPVKIQKTRRKENTSANYSFGYKFYCPFCEQFHNHGIGKGHRVAHCLNTSSPFKENGYFLKHFSKSELIQLREDIDIYLGNEGWKIVKEDEKTT